jgi:hypothetical protein
MNSSDRSSGWKASSISRHDANGMIATAICNHKRWEIGGQGTVSPIIFADANGSGGRFLRRSAMPASSHSVRANASRNGLGFQADPLPSSARVLFRRGGLLT